MKIKSLWYKFMESLNTNETSLAKKTYKQLPFTRCFILCHGSKWVVYRIKIESEEEICEESVTEDYGYTVVHTHKFFKGRYLGKTSHKKNNDLFKPMNKLTFMYTATVMYPFLAYEQKKKEFYSIFNTELCEITSFFITIFL